MKRLREFLFVVAAIGLFVPTANAMLRVLLTPADEAQCIKAGGKVVVQSDGKTKVCVIPPPDPGTAAPH